MNYIDRLKIKGVLYQLFDSSVDEKIRTAIENLIGAAPTTLDTLQEIAEAVQSGDSRVEAILTTLGNKANITTIVAPINEEDSTLPITTLTTEAGKYYRIDVPVETLNVTLPAITNNTKVGTVVLHLTGGTAPAITISSPNKHVFYQDDYKIETGKTYEINALFNGIAWVVTVVEIFVPELVVTKYNVTSTSEPTALRTSYEPNIFKSMEIDGVLLDNLVTEYTFDTTGVHTVKYELYDETKLGNSAPVFLNNNLVECIIPSSVISIGANAFTSCAGLTNIVIPDNVTDIGVNAFGGCTGLTSIAIGSSVENIGLRAFFNCISLTNLVIPDSVITIGESAFNGCNKLISITIPDSVTTIGNSAFAFTNALKVLNYNAKCELSTSFRSDWKNLETVVIGDSTPSIGNTVFQSCTGLTSVTIGNSVTDIYNGAFYGCTNLTSIDIPGNVTSIKQAAFYSCSGLVSVTLHDGLISIGDMAFQKCSSLTNITIPDSVTSIGTGAFDGCSSLTNYTIGNGVTSIGPGAFTKCSSLTSINIPSGVTSISNGMFNGCSSLTSVIIPNNITSIGLRAFESCTNLTSVTLPAGITNIDYVAFYHCSSLTSIVSNAMTAPTISSETFQDIKTGGTLTVPAGSTGYDVWMGTGNYYLGKYNWTKVEQQ